jgi:hypothetical protein
MSGRRRPDIPIPRGKDGPAAPAATLAIDNRGRGVTSRPDFSRGPPVMRVGPRDVLRPYEKNRAQRRVVHSPSVDSGDPVTTPPREREGFLEPAWPRAPTIRSPAPGPAPSGPAGLTAGDGAPPRVGAWCLGRIRRPLAGKLELCPQRGRNVAERTRAPSEQPRLPGSVFGLKMRFVLSSFESGHSLSPDETC